MNKTIYIAYLTKIKDLTEKYIKDLNQTIETINDTDNEKLHNAMIGNLMAHEEKYLQPLITFNKSAQLMAHGLKMISDNEN